MPRKRLPSSMEKKCPYLHYVPELSPLARRIIKVYENREVPWLYEKLVEVEIQECGDAVKFHRPDSIFSRHRMRALDAYDERDTADEEDGFSG